MVRQKVLVLGAGQVAGPAIEQLAHSYDLLVVDSNPEATGRIAERIRGIEGHALETRVSDAGDLWSILSDGQKADLVISLLPPPMHPDIAEVCIDKGIHLITPSYAGERMRQLSEAAERAGVLLLNEVGLDPGIDHMSAMRMIADVHQRGGRVLSFESYCGGLPSDPTNNPLSYQLSWSPRGMLTATKNPARFMRSGTIVELPEGRLYTETFTVTLPDGRTFEAYYNRDSLPYVDTYGLTGEVETFFRGTLRYAGWSETVQALTKLGCFDGTAKKTEESVKTYRDIFSEKYRHARHGGRNGSFTPATAAAYLGIDASSLVMQRLEWLGIFSDEQLSADAHVPFDALVSLVNQKLQYAPGQTDLVVMHHTLLASYGSQREQVNSSFIKEGIPHGDTAMAITVGLPVAYAAELVLQGNLRGLSGVHIPTLPEIYHPLLEKLGRGVVHFQETREQGV
ncbi:saccharopine dehydrogenase NADP-binding domain-containing protein [Candidatus Woesearchaeota archaeon]|nr:saccharopine dehydrogenase NADP-binding domain-containing protein [Candidatus Woesearchaeota archaeon]